MGQVCRVCLQGVYIGHSVPSLRLVLLVDLQTMRASFKENIQVQDSRLCYKTTLLGRPGRGHPQVQLTHTSSLYTPAELSVESICTHTQVYACICVSIPPHLLLLALSECLKRRFASVVSPSS
ncbi:hypothetical protein XENOCAPTIV_009837 [Xenoophorus captivus]|uniref:Uncharacterized protein n=1 Tax=Xenoophorus captivus TaxID=1517983 RepID=A0ABV0RYY1_9TELE